MSILIALRRGSSKAALFQMGPRPLFSIGSPKLVALCCLLGLVAISNSDKALGQNDSSLNNAVLSGFLGVWDVRPTRGQQQAEGERRGAPEQTGNRAPLQMPQIEGLDVGDRAAYRIMTAAGRAAFAAMNPRDLPTNNCQSSGLPTLAKVPNGQEWSVAGEVLSIHYGEFDTVRKVYLDGRPADTAPSQLGHSLGEFANGVLTIRTSNLVASLGALARNAPGSAQRSITEVYQSSANGRRVSGTITIEDPLYLTRPIEVPLTLVRAAEGAQILSFPCDVEASQRYLD